MVRSRMPAGKYVRVGYIKTIGGAFQQIILSQHHTQSELPRPIPWESDLGCTSRINFDNVTLTLHNVTLTSQKPCQHNKKV